MARSVRRLLAVAGNPDNGRLGISKNAQLLTVVDALLDVNIKKISCGAAHTAIVADDGSVYTMGLNTEYQLGLPWVDDSMAEVPVPQIVPLPEPCTDVACGSMHTIAIAESGNLWSWGSASCVAPLGLGKKARSSKEPKLVDALRGVDIASVACGSSHTMALSQQGELFSWGLAMKGCLGHEPASKWLSSEHLYYPKLVRSLTDEKMVKVAAGHYHSACISHDGDVYFWGSGEYGQTTHRRDITVPQHFERGKFKDVACGGMHTLALNAQGAILSCGANQHGCLGYGNGAAILDVNTLTPISGGKNIGAVSVSAGWKHSAALGGGGMLFTWGWGGSVGEAYSFQDDMDSTGGQLGLNDEYDRWGPSLVEVIDFGDAFGGVKLRVQDEGQQVWSIERAALGWNHTAVIVEMI